MASPTPSPPAALRDSPARVRLMLVTDAWHPQVNGVVRTWTEVQRELLAEGHEVNVIHPGLFRTVAMPRYPEIRLAVLAGRQVGRLLDAAEPDAIHIATEGPLGQAARRYCRRRRLRYTTSYHTQFPYYLKAYAKVPPALTYRFIRWFHGSAEAVLVPTPKVGDELRAQGLTNTVVWTRGVDTQLFQPHGKGGMYDHLPRPTFLYAGRVAVEKNIEAFLGLDLPGSKVVVGDGPAKPALQRRYPNVHWAGYQFGEALARHYAAADVFVFPSRTDTFGVVMLEANACGLPVAAYPVTGPIDVVKPGVTGALDEDLRKACLAALEVDPAGCRTYAEAHSWANCARILLEHLAPLRP